MPLANRDAHCVLTKQRRRVDPNAAKLACVYKITGPGGKLYIGKTVSSLMRRMTDHKEAKDRRATYLTHAIRKHGRAAFTIESVLVGTEEYCFEMEAKLVAAYDTLRPNGYNVWFLDVPSGIAMDSEF